MLLQPGSAAGQSFTPTLNVLCTLALQLLADVSDLGRRFIYDVTLRETLDGPAIASLHVDTYLNEQQTGNWDAFIHVVPNQRYFAVVEPSPGSRPLRWYWANFTYAQGEAWVRNGASWQEEAARDLLFSTSGFDDVSPYPLPDPSWTPEQWRTNNWKTYPRTVASFLDLNGDGTADVYAFNNSYGDGTPVATSGTVNVSALDASRMAPVNLSMAFEYTSYRNSADNRSSLKIVISRIVDHTKNGSGAWPAWIVLDNVRFLPLLLSPEGTTLDALNLTWNSTLEKNDFQVYFKDVEGHPDGQVWIYIGHFSTQAVILRGPTWTLLASRPLVTEFMLAIVAASSVLIAAVVLVEIRRRRRRLLHGVIRGGRRAGERKL